MIKSGNWYIELPIYDIANVGHVFFTVNIKLYTMLIYKCV